MKRNLAINGSLKGFTLLETLFVLLIIGLLTMVGSPALMESIRHQQLKSAVQSTYLLIKTARSMSIRLNKDIRVQFKAVDNWCIALNDTDSCDCQKPNHCTVQGQSYLLQQTDFPDVSLNQIVMGKLNTLTFDRHRGISVGNGGSGKFVSKDLAGKFIVSNLGRVRICMSKGQMGEYPSC